ncbi:MAG TPA: hypothetical protein PLV92_23920, partial [Pirellulaceae bacterium]|nr:hypothetical protein [Pirellulaceae bacterium]
IKSLGDTRDAEAVEPLRAILLDDAAAPELRVAAAGAIGNILDSKAVVDASDLAGRKLQPAHFGPLLAVKLLVRHRDGDAVKVLDQLAKHAEPAVATEALGRLLAIDLALAEPHVAAASTSADAGLRKLAAQTWVRRGTVEAIRSLGPMLNDRNPTVRRFVAVNFVEFGRKAELKGAVIEESTKVLAGDQWRGLEQAALVLGSLDHEPAAPRLIELLPNPRAEVAVTVAWALKKLKIPETLPALLAHAKSVDKAIRGMGAPPHLGPQVSQIFQTFGDQRYRESEELLRTWVPKSMLDPNARAAACWALGYFHVNEPDCDLVPVFVARLSDVSSPLPEMPAVRQLTAVGLGRMRAASQLEVLRRFAKLDGNKLATGIACGWSIEQLTGEKMKVSGPLEFGVGGWFIEPLDDPESPKPEDFLSAPVPTTPNEPMPDGGPVKGPPPGGAGPGGGRPGGGRPGEVRRPDARARA